MPYLTPETLPAAYICRRLRIPNDIGFIQAVNGALLELCQVYNWEQAGAVTPEQARAAMLDMLLDTLDAECPDETPEPGEKLVFGPDASLITYAPQDPFSASEIVPPGYVQAPLYEIAEGVIPFPGVQPGDVLTDLTKLPTAWPPLLPPDGYPRFRVNFHVTGPGPGEVELHLVKLPAAGLALVTLDGDPGTADFIDLATADVLDLADLGALLGTVLDGDLVRTHIQELHIATPGDHFIDVTFLPKLGASSLVGFGGGLRQVVLGGTAEAGSMPAPQFRLTGTVLEWRPHDAHVWIELGDLGAEVGAAIETTEIIPVTWEDTPGLVYDAEEKKLSLTLPVGYPPVNDIQSVTVDVVNGDTQPGLDYDPMTKTLAATLQAQWLRGIRTVGYNPTRLEIQTYANPGEWVLLGLIPSLSPTGGYPLAPAPTPQVGASDDENKCLASKAAVEVIRRSYVEIGERVAFEVLNSWGISHAMSVAGAGLLNLGAALMGGGIGLGLVVAAQDLYALNPLDEPFLEQLLSMFYDAAAVDADGIVTWDIEDIYDALDQRWMNDLDQRWMNVKYLIQVVGQDGLNAAGAVYFGQVADCTGPAEWEYTVDFTSSSGLWNMNPSFGAGAMARVNGVGWPSASGGEGAGAYRSQELILLTPGGYNPDLTLTQVKITYEVVDGTPTHPATAYNIGMLLIQGAGASPDHLLTPAEDSPYAETVRTLTFDHPGYTGVYSVIWRLFATSAAPEIVVKSITVKGLGENPYV